MKHLAMGLFIPPMNEPSHSLYKRAKMIQGTLKLQLRTVTEANESQQWFFFFLLVHLHATYSVYGVIDWLFCL